VVEHQERRADGAWPPARGAHVDLGTYHRGRGGATCSRPDQTGGGGGGGDWAAPARSGAPPARGAAAGTLDRLGRRHSREQGRRGDVPLREGGRKKKTVRYV
jgi:hypothetical protein